MAASVEPKCDARPLLSAPIPPTLRTANHASAITADKMCYGGWSTAANAAPSAPNFLLRARLVEFDTKNNVPNATGWLWYALGKTDDIKSPITATIG